MNQFVVSDDGMLREHGVEATARELQLAYPSLDVLGWEGNIALSRIHRTLTAILAPIFEPAGLTPTRVVLLSQLSSSPSHRLAIRDLAAAMQVTPANITQVVAGLEKSHLVRRLKDPNDGRSIIVEITDKGVSTLESVRPLQIERVSTTWAGLTDKEKVQLLHLLAKLRMLFLTSSDGVDFTDDRGNGRREAKKPRAKRKPAVASETRTLTPV